MASKTYSIEEIDNINLGRAAKFGVEYKDVRGYKYLGVEEGRLMRLRLANETLVDPSLLLPNITNVQQAITYIFNILSAGTGVNSVSVIAPITLSGTASDPIIGYKPTTEQGIVAHAGGLQALARPLLCEYSFVDTVATAGDSVLTLPAIIGTRQFIRNFGAFSMNVFPYPSCNFYGKGANIPQAITPGNGRWFICSATNEFRII